jgi:hypothetical protein
VPGATDTTGAGVTQPCRAPPRTTGAAHTAGPTGGGQTHRAGSPLRATAGWIAAQTTGTAVTTATTGTTGIAALPVTGR